MMDITRNLVKESQENTLADVKIGKKNVIVSTLVAEEACCSVIRWDPPLNMASWAQSRGRARKKCSTFTVMFDEDTRQREDVAERRCGREKTWRSGKTLNTKWWHYTATLHEIFLLYSMTIKK